MYLNPRGTPLDTVAPVTKTQYYYAIYPVRSYTEEVLSTTLVFRVKSATYVYVLADF